MAVWADNIGVKIFMGTLTRKQLQVLNTVIVLNTILMMNPLGGKKATPKMFGHYIAMFKELIGITPSIGSPTHWVKGLFGCSQRQPHIPLHVCSTPLPLRAPLRSSISVTFTILTIIFHTLIIAAYNPSVKWSFA